MKTRVFALVGCLAVGLSPGLFRASAELEVSAGINIQSPADFYGPLAADGSWIQSGSFGRCWRPAGVTAGWRPYCNGDWEWTDCGWYWVSDEPWAWACYHYGTWAYDPNDGWVWIPDVEWAPAWVYWRTGGDYIGWVPCGPPGFSLEPSFYIFVQGRHFHDHIRPDNVIVNNAAIINQTTEIRNVTREQRQFGGKSQTVVVNNGPGLAMVEKATGHKFTPVPVQKADQSTVRSVPKQLLKKPGVESRTTEPESHATQRPVEELPKAGPGGNQEIPHNLQPQQEVPMEKGLPPERTLPQTPQERTVPQAPLQKLAPPAKNEMPREPQHPKEVVPPGQLPHPAPPAIPPGNPPPNGNGPDKDHNQGNG